MEFSLHLLDSLKLKIEGAVESGDFDKIRQLDREYDRVWNGILDAQPAEPEAQKEMFLFLLDQLTVQLDSSPEIDKIKDSLIRLYSDAADQ